MGVIALFSNCGGGGVGDLIAQVTGIGAVVAGSAIAGLWARPRTAERVIGGAVLGFLVAGGIFLVFLFLGFVFALARCSA